MKVLLIISNVVAALATLFMIGFGGATSSAYFIVAINALCVLIVLSDRRPNTSVVDQQLVRLRRLAIRLSYLQDEGCLTQKGGEVSFDFHGDDTAAAEALTAISEIARIGK